MNIADRISSTISDLTAKPADVDLSAISALLSEIRTTIGAGPDRTGTENGLSQPGAASNKELLDKITKLEQDLKSYNDLFSHLKNVLSGKINIIYGKSKLKDQLLSEVSNDISIQSFLKLQEQIEHQFNTSWFPQEHTIEVSKNRVLIPDNHKSGGIPWHHE